MVAQKQRLLVVIIGLATLLAACASPAGNGSPSANQAAVPGGPIKIGIQYDGSGPVANLGVKVRDGAKDWNDYVNSKGGVNGHAVEFIYEDNKYEASSAMSIYKRWLANDKIAGIMAFGTPPSEAVGPLANKDKVPMFSPGFGLSDSVDGKAYPYSFVLVASYSAQASAILKWVKDNWKGPANAKVAVLYYDNPAGRDPLPALRKVSRDIGIDLVNETAVPTTAKDTTNQLQEIQKTSPDFIISHLFGRLPAVSLQDRAKLGIKTPTISFVWGISEEEIAQAGPAAEGYMGIQFAAVADDQPQALEQLKQWYQSQGKPLPTNHNSVYYARGVLTAAMIHAGIAAAGNAVNGETLKKGMETLKDFTAFGLSSGTTVTGEDHGGTRKVRMYRVESGKLKLINDWFEGPPS